MFSKQGFVTVCLVILTALLITGCLPTTPTPVAVTGVTLDQATMTLTAGGATGTLVATVAPATTTNKSVTWSSSAPAVATVSVSGVVTPLTAGTTIITVTTVDGSKTATRVVTVTITPVAATAVAVTFSNLTANGTSAVTTTTILTLTFDIDPTTLAVGDITVTGATKGTLSGTGTTRTLAISNITVVNGADVTVAIADPAGFAITPASKTVAVNVKVYALCETGPAGGLIFYVKEGGYSDGWMYLEAAPSDQSASTEWGCEGVSIPGADGTAVGTGEQNTIDIEAECTTDGTAADICANLSLGGYSDWFLPSKDELNLMYTNLKVAGFGGFSGYYYWSSSEYNANDAWYQYFYFGSQNYYSKSNTSRVRAVRAF